LNFRLSSESTALYLKVSSDIVMDGWSTCDASPFSLRFLAFLASASFVIDDTGFNVLSFTALQPTHKPGRFIVPTAVAFTADEFAFPVAVMVNLGDE
jgi:hypothetical protein